MGALGEGGPVTRCSRTRSDRPGLAFRRDHTLGVLLERLAEVRGSTDLVEEADGGLTLTIAEAAHLVDRWAGRIAVRVQAGRGRGGGHAQRLRAAAAVPRRLRAGAVPAPVNALMRPDEIAHVECRLGRRGHPIHAVSDLPAAQALGHAVPAEPDDVAALFYTSGTTGKPKGVELTHKGLLGGVMAGTLIPGGIRHDTAVVSLPMAHIMGFAVALGMACAGVPVWFLPRFHPVRVLDAIETRRASLFVGVPAMYRMLLEAGAEDRDLKSVRVWVSGADAMPAELAARFKKLGATAVLPVVGAVGEAAFAEGYGMVETGGGVAAKVSPPMFGRRPRLVDGHAPSRLLVQGGRRGGRGGPPGRGRRAAREGTRGHHRLPGRRGRHRGHVHRRRLAADGRPRPAGAAATSCSSPAARRTSSSTAATPCTRSRSNRSSSSTRTSSRPPSSACPTSARARCPGPRCCGWSTGRPSTRRP